nr:6-phosphogluconate dehydrogenase, decarboxylating 2, chloroplastic [Quercus suber]
MEPGDSIIDGGNEWYLNIERRIEQASSQGLLYLGMGVSGGEEGARYDLNHNMEQAVLDGLQNLLLTKEEEECIQITNQGRVELLEDCFLSLSGKLLSSRLQNQQALKGTLRAAWKMGSDLRILEYRVKTKKNDNAGSSGGSEDARQPPAQVEMGDTATDYGCRIQKSGGFQESGKAGDWGPRGNDGRSNCQEACPV